MDDTAAGWKKHTLSTDGCSVAGRVFDLKKNSTNESSKLGLSVTGERECTAAGGLCLDNKGDQGLNLNRDGCDLGGRSSSADTGTSGVY